MCHSARFNSWQRMGSFHADCHFATFHYVLHACLAKHMKHPWCTKTPKNKEQQQDVVTMPGQCVSVDQLKSSHPGLIAQMQGIPTKQCYNYATVFVDQYSKMSFVYLQKTSNSEETVQAKKAFEAFTQGHGVTRILHYHADNGIFADNKWRDAVRNSNQTLSFCGVNAHFQNGVAERHIHELQEHARSMLLHAHKQWPTAITPALWPYALCMANDLINNTPDLKSKREPIMLFSGSKVAIEPKHWLPFGCPLYVLANALQAGKKIPKWSNQARVAVYLGQSPQHA
jgi:hypothetical protein